MNNLSRKNTEEIKKINVFLNKSIKTEYVEEVMYNMDETINSLTVYNNNCRLVVDYDDGYYKYFISIGGYQEFYSDDFNHLKTFVAIINLDCDYDYTV